MCTKEQYSKCFLIILILVLSVIIFIEFLPFLSGLLGALTIYVLVRKQMTYFTQIKKLNNSTAAILILLEVVLCFLIPTFLAIWLLVNKLQTIDLQPQSIVVVIQKVVSIIHEKTGYNILSTDNLSSATSFATKALQSILGGIGVFVINSIVLVFILYFMLVGSKQMEAYIYDILPFSNENKKNIIKEINVMVKSNAIGIPLLAVIQGIIAMIGYIIFGVPDPVLFAFLTCFATIIPLIGTSLIWFPLSVYLALTGNWPAAIGLAIYSLIIISNVDNLIRFMLQKKIADTHPLITVFGVIIGLTLFGFWGVIFGPLLLSIYLLCVNIFKKEYLDITKN